MRDQDKQWMQHALQLARKGGGQVSPNPQVGAVLIREGRLIGQGYHQVFGGPHAEVNAITDCVEQGNDPAGATIFVTLEPCCHIGKTGPCTEAIVKAGICEVVVGCPDENPQVGGKGIARLREQGVNVEVGCCEREANQIVAGFFKWQRTKLPRVILKWAQSLDGQLAWPGDSPNRWISNEKSRAHVQTIRQQCGAILVGIETVLADDPKLSVRLPHVTSQPLRVVLDSHLRIPLACHLAQTAREQPVVIFILTESLVQKTKKAETLKQLGCELIDCASPRIELPDVLQNIGERKITDLLIEGGPTVLESFLTQHLADEVKIYIAPITIGHLACSVSGWQSESLIRSQLTNPTQQHFEQDLLIEGAI